MRGLSAKKILVTVLLTNHALPRHSIKTEQVRVRVDRIRRASRRVLQRIDEEHANPRRLWREMGEPEYLKASEIEQLQAASRLTRSRNAGSMQMRASTSKSPCRRTGCAVHYPRVFADAPLKRQVKERIEQSSLGEDELADLQKATFGYFLKETNLENGMVPRQHQAELGRQHHRHRVRAHGLSRRRSSEDT